MDDLWYTYNVFFNKSRKAPASIAKSNKQLFGYGQIAKRIANICLTYSKYVAKYGYLCKWEKYMTKICYNLYCGVIW